MQVIDPHTHLYLDRLKDEPVLLALAAKTSAYLTRLDDTRTLSSIALRRMEHFYHKTQGVYEAMKQITLQQQRESAEAAEAAEVSPSARCQGSQLPPQRMHGSERPACGRTFVWTLMGKTEPAEGSARARRPRSRMT